MADQLTLALRHADAWSPTIPGASVHVEHVERAIELWHVEHGLGVPSDPDFAAAKWFVPTGTEHEHHPDRPTAERLLVVLPRGRRYLLTVEREGGGGDDGRRECVTFFVKKSIDMREDLSLVRV